MTTKSRRKPPGPPAPPTDDTWNASREAHGEAILGYLNAKYELSNPENGVLVPDDYHAALAVSTFVQGKANLRVNPNEPARIHKLVVPHGWYLEDSVRVADTAFQLIRLGREKLYFNRGDKSLGTYLSQEHPQVTAVFETPTDIADQYIYSQLFPRQEREVQGVPIFEDMVFLCTDGNTSTGAQLHKEAIGKRWQAQVSQPRGMGTLIK